MTLTSLVSPNVNHFLSLVFCLQVVAGHTDTKLNRRKKCHLGQFRARRWGGNCPSRAAAAGSPLAESLSSRQFLLINKEVDKATEN